MAEIDFQHYVAHQTGRLLRLAYLLTGDAHTAEDLVQEALSRCHRRWDRVSGAASPDAYVRRAVINQHNSWRRRRSSSELAVVPALLPSARSGARLPRSRNARAVFAGGRIGGTL